MEHHCKYGRLTSSGPKTTAAAASAAPVAAPAPSSESTGWGTPIALSRHRMHRLHHQVGRHGAGGHVETRRSAAARGAARALPGVLVCKWEREIP